MSGQVLWNTIENCFELNRGTIDSDFKLLVYPRLKELVEQLADVISMSLKLACELVGPSEAILPKSSLSDGFHNSVVWERYRGILADLCRESKTATDKSVRSTEQMILTHVESTGYYAHAESAKTGTVNLSADVSRRVRSLLTGDRGQHPIDIPQQNPSPPRVFPIVTDNPQVHGSTNTESALTAVSRDIPATAAADLSDFIEESLAPASLSLLTPKVPLTESVYSGLIVSSSVASFKSQKSTFTLKLDSPQTLTSTLALNGYAFQQLDLPSVGVVTFYPNQPPTLEIPGQTPSDFPEKRRIDSRKYKASLVGNFMLGYTGRRVEMLDEYGQGYGVLWVDDKDRLVLSPVQSGEMGDKVSDGHIISSQDFLVEDFVLLREIMSIILLGRDGSVEVYDLESESINKLLVLPDTELTYCSLDAFIEADKITLTVVGHSYDYKQNKLFLAQVDTSLRTLLNQTGSSGIPFIRLSETHQQPIKLVRKVSSNLLLALSETKRVELISIKTGRIEWTSDLAPAEICGCLILGQDSGSQDQDQLQVAIFGTKLLSILKIDISKYA